MKEGPDAREIRVVCALLELEGRLLITQRPSKGANALRWEFPGGKVAPGESDAEALVRELREELGIDVHVMGVYRELSEVSAHGRLTLCFLWCSLENGQPACIEVEAFAWVTRPQLLDYDLTPSDLEVATVLAQQA